MNRKSISIKELGADSCNHISDWSIIKGRIRGSCQGDYGEYYIKCQNCGIGYLGHTDLTISNDIYKDTFTKHPITSIKLINNETRLLTYWPDTAEPCRKFNWTQLKRF